MNLLDALSRVSYLLDTPGAHARGVLAGQPGTRTSGREMLQSWGLLGENTPGLDAGDVAGFGAEMLVDPLNLVPLGWASKISKANTAIKAGNKASTAMRAAGAMPAELIPKLHPSVMDQATGMPKRFYHGTPHVFDKFEPKVLSDKSLYGRGIYMTDSPTVASSYTDKSGIGYQSAKQIVDNATLRKELNNIYNTVPDSSLGRAIFNDPVDLTAADKRRILLDDLAELQDDELAYSHGTLEAMGLSRPDLFSPGYWPEKAPNVRMHYIDARNPFVMENDYEVGELNRAVRTILPKADYSSLGTSLTGDTFARRVSSTPETARQMLANAGYDAIQHRGGQLVGGLGDHNVTIAFDPAQVYAPYVAPAIKPKKSYRNALLAAAALQAAKQLRGRE